MGKQITFEDIKVGMEVPPLVKHPTTRQLVKWAGVSSDWYEIHYDKDAALAAKLPGVIVHGWIPFCAHGQMLQDWIGINGDLKYLNCSYRGMLLPGHDATYKGKVTQKYTKDGQNLVECETWCENDKGEVVNQAKAIVSLP